MSEFLEDSDPGVPSQVQEYLNRSTKELLRAGIGKCFSAYMDFARNTYAHSTDFPNREYFESLDRAFVGAELPMAIKAYTSQEYRERRFSVVKVENSGRVYLDHELPLFLITDDNEVASAPAVNPSPELIYLAAKLKVEQDSIGWNPLFSQENE